MLGGWTQTSPWYRPSNCLDIATGVISMRQMFERRVVTYPAGFCDGQLFCNTYLGDYPQYLPGAKAQSVHVTDFPAYAPMPEDTSWDALFRLRDEVTKVLEIARDAKQIGQSLGADIVLYTLNTHRRFPTAAIESHLLGLLYSRAKAHKL